MERKKLVYLGLFIGSSVGGFIPSLWDGGVLSMSGIILSGIGGILGIYLGFKFGD